MLKTDLFWYGFLFTTGSYSTRFNDQFNVFRIGTPGQVLASPDAPVETLTFTDPESGVTYAATQPRCDEGIAGGSRGLCGACEESADCAGHLEGYYGEVFCIDDGSGGICAQDCTNDAGLCPDGFSCEDGTGNCVPDGLACLEAECSVADPLGRCEEGATCVEGQCISRPVRSPQCDISGGDDRVAARLIQRGRDLTREYLASSDTLSGATTDEAYNRAITQYYRARYYLRNHVELLETLRSTYEIFGQVY